MERVLARPEQVARARASLVWPALAVGGIVVALSALLGPADESGFGAARVTVRLPDFLALTILIALTITALLMPALVLFRDRRRPKDEEEPQDPRPKIPRWVRVLMWAQVLLPMALLAYFAWMGWDPAAMLSSLYDRAGMDLPSFPDVARPEISIPFVTWTIGLAGLAVSLLSLALVVWLLIPDRFWLRPAVSADLVNEPLIEAVEDSIDDLRREPDARVAVIRCYRRFEQALARSSVARASWQTPLEFMRTALKRLPLSPAAVERLTRLFEIARFSGHPLGSLERDVACECLTEIHETLDRRNPSESTV